MKIKATDRPWYQVADWKQFILIHLDDSFPKLRDHYNYIKSIEKIRDIADCEANFAKAYEIVLGERDGNKI